MLHQHKTKITLITGALFSLAFAPFFIWPLGLFCLAILFWLLHHGQKRHVFLWVFAHQITSLYWLPRSFMIDAKGDWLPAFYAGIPALIAIAAVLSAYVLLMVFWVKKLPQKYWSFAFIFGWLTVEILRTLQPLPFPWNPLGAIFAGHDSLLQTASLGGVWLLSVLALLCGWALSQNNQKAFIAPLILLLMLGYGHQRLQQAEVTFTETKVRLIQGNFPTAHSWTGPERAEHLMTQVSMMHQTDNRAIDLFIWPETAIAYAVLEDPQLQESLSRQLLPHQQLILGFMRWERPSDAPTKYFNSMGIIKPNATVNEIYDKNILVPFGEGLPFPTLTQHILRTLSFNRGTYWQGETTAKMDVGNTHALPLICYEGAFSGFVQKQLYAAQNQQTFLLNITNDNWFDGTTSPHQHNAMAKIRAVETGLPLIRVANTGRTVVTDAYGRTLAKLPMRVAKTLDIHIPTAIQPPLYRQLWQNILNRINP